MQAYLALSRLFPRSFTAKVFFLAFIGTHVPLIALLAWLVPLGAATEQGDVLLVVLLATLGGTAATLLSLQAILRPLSRLDRALRRFEEEGQIDPLPTTLQDEIGRLMRRATRLMQRVSARIESTQRSADTDPLTGVLNRRGFDRALLALTDGRTGADGMPGAVVHFDLDRFKAINDTYGHDVGDEVLVAVAGVAQRSLRKGDLLARFGGEEFVAYLPETDAQVAEQIAERIRARIEAEVRAGAGIVTASLGVSAGASGAAQLIRMADAATYASKGAGRNRVTLAAA